MKYVGTPNFWTVSLKRLSMFDLEDHVVVGWDDHHGVVIQRDDEEQTLHIGYPPLGGQIVFPIYANGQKLSVGHMLEFGQDVIIHFTPDGVWVVHVSDLPAQLDLDNLQVADIFKAVVWSKDAARAVHLYHDMDNGMNLSPVASIIYDLLVKLTHRRHWHWPMDGELF